MQVREASRIPVVQQPWYGRLTSLAFNLTIVVLLDKFYEFTRGVVPRQDVIALQNGLEVVRIEKALHIFDEWRLQAVVLAPLRWTFGPLAIDRNDVVSAINHMYLYSHFVGTFLFLAWLFWWRREHFYFVRTIFMAATSMTLAVYILFPMMPPRLMGARMQLPHNYRFQDTLAPILNYKLQAAQIGYNPYASMPSLHFAWAIILGVTLVLIGNSLILQIIGALYQLLMLTTIVVSGNHLLLDAAGSVVVVGVAVMIAGVVHRYGTTLRHYLRQQHRGSWDGQLPL